MRLSRGDHGGAAPFRQIETQGEGVEQVFLEIQTTLPLDAIFEIEKPLALRDQFLRVMGEEKVRKTGIGLHAHQPLSGIERRIQRVVMMRSAVIIAKGDQRAKLQHALWFRGIVDGTDFILHHRGIFTMDHEDALLDLQAGHAVGEHRKRIQAEFLQILIALGINGAGILVGREFIALAIDDHRFFQFRQQQHAAGGRRRRSGKQSVIAARVEANHGRRGEAAQAVGLQPFPRKRQIQPGANTLIETNDS